VAVVVIGAGVVGASCALLLAEAGEDVIVIDRGAIVSGTTGAGEGNILVSDKEPGPELTLALRSRDAWFEIADRLGDDKSGGFELHDKGGIVVTRHQHDPLIALSVEQQQHGVNVEQCSAADLHSLEPHLNPEIPFGIHYPQDAQCQPMKAAAVMLRRVRQLGGEVRTRTSVTGFTSRGGVLTGVTTSDGVIDADAAVNASGTWAGEVAALAGSHLPIAPRRGFILVTAPMPPMIHHKVYDADYVADVASGEEALQSSAVVEGTPSGTILIGASRERVGFAGALDVAVLRRLAAQAVALFPALTDVHLLRAYHGFRPYAPDHLPVIGPDPVLSGLWHAAGHEGAGIGLAPATGELITAGILGRAPFMDPTPFAPARFAVGA
jgi:glycine/D-amino acid oxidase-like deaminating enzyme